MSRLGSAGFCATTAIALAALLAPVGPGRGEARANDAAPAQATTPAQPETKPADAKPSDAKSSDAKPSDAKPALGEKIGPDKPAANRAIRAALLRAASEAGRITPEIRAQMQAVSAFYAGRGDAPLWLDKGKWTPAARAAFQRLQHAPDDGLDLRAYRVYALDQGPEASLALGDVALSEAVAGYASQASGGRVDPARLSDLIGSKPEIVRRLKPCRTSHRRRTPTASCNPTIRNPPAISPCATNWRSCEPNPRPWRSSRPPRTASATNGPATPSPEPLERGAALEAEILANMEFWRWQPRDPGADRIVVNVPEFTSRLYRDNALALSTRVIVGQPTKETPLFSSKLEYLIVNPSWNVPELIIKNEMMNKLGALSRMGYSVRYVHGKLHVRQEPGERNALGRIKFIFPNNYSVYLHDTPTRSLFASARRALSHGCVRVDQPFQFAVALLGADHGWSEEKLKKMLGKSERRVNLPTPLPIHIVYFTLTANDQGRLEHFGDVYGYAAKMRELMGLGG